MTTPRSVRLVRLLAVAALAVMLAGCQVRVATDIEVARDGSGRLQLLVALDQELSESLDADGIDPFEGLEELGDDWTTGRETIDGGNALRISTNFSSPAELADRVDALADGTDEDDPAVLEAVAVSVDADGRADFRARAGLRPPASTGIEAEGLQPDGDALAQLLEERGDDLVRVELRVTLPGSIETVDGGDPDLRTVDGRTVVWDLPPTGLVEVRAVGAPPTDRTLIYAIAVAIAAAALAAAAVAVRRP